MNIFEESDNRLKHKVVTKQIEIYVRVGEKLHSHPTSGNHPMKLVIWPLAGLYPIHDLLSSVYPAVATKGIQVISSKGLG
jgi:hypothetical protein